MFDPTATYRTAQVTTASPASQIVLLYQGAIRFGTQHLCFLEQKNFEAAHKASIRAEEVVSALRTSLDMSAGPVAAQLDQLYDFVLRRLIDGNVSKTPRPTEEALEVLRGLLEAWQQLASRPAAELAPRPTLVSSNPAPQAIPMSVPAAMPRAVAGGLR